MTTFTQTRRRSARETFANCQRRYKGEYLDMVNGGSDATRRGNVFHDARAHYINALFAMKVRADSDLAEASWHHVITQTPLPNAEYEDTRSLWLNWVERYELNLVTFYSAEQSKFCKEFNCDLRMDETHVPHPDVFQIVDAKTHWQMPTVDRLSTAVQTGMYLAGARHIFPGFDRYEIVYDFVRLNQHVTICLSDAELDAWDKWVAESDEAMDMAETVGIFPATGGAHCSTCMVKCPLADEPARNVVRFATEQEAQDAASRIAARARANAIETQVLKDYANEHGPLVSGNQEWSHRLEVKKTYNADAVLKVLRANEVDYALWLSATAVKGLLTAKKYKPVADQVAALAVSKVGTKFSAKTIAGEDDAPKPEDE